MTSGYIPTKEDWNDLHTYLYGRIKAQARARGIRTTAQAIETETIAVKKKLLPFIKRWRASNGASAGLNAGKRMWELANKDEILAHINDENGEYPRADWHFVGDNGPVGDDSTPSDYEGLRETREEAGAGTGADNGEEAEDGEGVGASGDGEETEDGNPTEGAGAGDASGDEGDADGDEGEGESDANGDEGEGEDGEESEAEDETEDEDEAEDETRQEEAEEAVAEAKDTLSSLLSDNLLNALEQLIDGRITLADLNGLIKGRLDEKKVAEMIAEAVKGASPTGSVTVKVGDMVREVSGLLHPKFARILSYVANGQNVYLYGPAGTGKSTVVGQIGEALNLPVYYYQALLSKWDILGRVGLDGNYVPSEFYKAFTEGGIVLVDEMDASVPEAIVSINTALANGYYAFPNGTAKKHPDFHFIGAGNTIGRGADADMTGRFALDQASLDRFALVYMGYSHDILMHTANNDEVLVKYFEDLQRVIRDNGMSLAITPRSLSRIVSQRDNYLDNPEEFNLHIPSDISEEDYICAVLLYEGLFKGMEEASVQNLAYGLSDNNCWTRATKLIANNRLRDGFEA